MKFEDVTRHAPQNVKGSVTLSESKFIYDQIIRYNAANCIEIGVASGCSSAVIVAALEENQANAKTQNHCLFSYDLLKHCYWNKSLSVGYGGREMLKDLDSYNWVLRTKTTCLDLKKYHLVNSVDFIFIDACHDHPWPAIDTLACLPYIKNGGVICLHDINLPTVNRRFQIEGVKNVYYGLKCKKFSIDEKIPNIGCIVINNNKRKIRNQLCRIIRDNDWKTKVGDDILNELNIVL